MNYNQADYNPQAEEVDPLEGLDQNIAPPPDNLDDSNDNPDQENHEDQPGESQAENDNNNPDEPEDEQDEDQPGESQGIPDEDHEMREARDTDEQPPGPEEDDGPFRDVPDEERNLEEGVPNEESVEMREGQDEGDIELDDPNDDEGYDEFGNDDGEDQDDYADEVEDNEELGEEEDEEMQYLNYEVYDPDEDDDFPEYGNEQNKKLNEQIKEERKRNKEIASKCEDINERQGIMKEHHKNINQELKNTKALIDAKNTETDTEKHLSQVAERQVGRITRELKKLDSNGIELQDRLNTTQQEIFRGNEKLDKYKLEINWNQEEMEQWALAAKQKEEDNLTLEKYRSADDIRIKEQSLQLEKLTIEKNREESELEKEITETQAYQIEIDKTAEEFKKQHQQRHRIYAQWDEAIHNIAKRHEATQKAGEDMAKIKLEMKRNSDILEERKKHLEREKHENKRNEEEIAKIERRIISKKNENKDRKRVLENQKAEVKIFQNRLSAYSSELGQKRNKIQFYEKELLGRKQRLTTAERKYKSQVAVLDNEESLEASLKEMSERAEKDYNSNIKERSKIEKDIRQKKDEYFKAQQELFKLREHEANLYSEIQGTMAALRNLQSHINKLNQEFQRQQELLYNAEYQIQLLERKVARAHGEKTNEEAQQLRDEILAAKAANAQVKKEHKSLDNALKNQADEKRFLQGKMKKLEEDRSKNITLIEKLNLENDMTQQELSKIVKTKEETLVSHDIMKLEIKKIQDRLKIAQDDVLQLENKKNQYELAMAEREKEISVHRCVLTAEFKAAEQERHKTAVSQADRTNKVRNLKIKYESLIQRKQGSSATNVNEHSQAYYIIKAAQEKEELQRKEDELKAKILKNEKELKALVNTQSHLKNRNSNYRDYFINKGATQKDVELKNNLDEQCKVAADNLMQKKKEFEKMKKETDDISRNISEMNNKVITL